jgi:hypothetical protein
MKPVHDFSDEFHHLSHCNGGCGLYFDPFCEFFHYYEDVCGKRPGDQFGLELMRQHMFLVSKELAPFTVTDQGVDVRDDSGLVEPLPIRFAQKHACALMTVANP